VSGKARPWEPADEWSTATVLFFFIALGIVLIFSPLLYSHVGGGSGRHPAPPIETFATLLVMTYSIYAIVRGASRRRTERIGGIIAYAVVFAVAVTALWGLPQWSGLVAAGALVALIFAPNWLASLSRRQSTAGWRRRAAFSWRLASWLHPSRAMRFYAGVVRAGALPSTDAEVAAYASMRQDATPHELRILDCATAWAHDDWTGVLDHSRDVPELKGYEIRALAELGRVDETIAAIATLWPKPRGRDLDHCGLIALAVAGRIDGVRTLLQGKLRFVRPDVVAYWSFIAATAAGVSDDSRGALEACARQSDDEWFRRAAQRHLAAAVPSASPTLSPASAAAIAEIEAALGPPPGR
jgi:hypothetical protein